MVGEEGIEYSCLAKFQFGHRPELASNGKLQLPLAVVAHGFEYTTNNQTKKPTLRRAFLFGGERGIRTLAGTCAPLAI